MERTREEILRRVASVPWFHAFEVLPGVITPGVFRCDPSVELDAYGVDFRGRRVLEIGTWDGPFAFELERRGADVTALDIHDPSATGFNVAKSLRRSAVRYVQGNVYDLASLFDRPFDIVCFFGVFYHLKDPLRAFEQIAGMLSEEGCVLIEGECIRNYGETLDGRRVVVLNPIWRSLWRHPMAARRFAWLGRLISYLHPKPRRLDRFVRRSAEVACLAAVADSELPLTLCYPGRYKGASNWFVPNVACLRSWLTAAGLTLAWHRIHEDVLARTLDGSVFPMQRIKGVARKCDGRAIVPEHPIQSS